MTKSEKLEFQIERKKRILAEAQNRKTWRRLRKAWETMKEQNKMLETYNWYIDDIEQKLAKARSEFSVLFQQQQYMQETVVQYLAVTGSGDTKELAKRILADQAELAA